MPAMLCTVAYERLGRQVMAKRHTLERKLNVSSRSILDAIRRSNRILVAVKGAVAQERLRIYLKRKKASGVIEEFESIDADGQPDFRVRYRGRNYLVECKNVQKTMRRGEMTVDFMKTRYAKTKKPATRFYGPSDFHVLAACLFNQTGKWEFRFIPTTRLPRHPRYRSRLDSRVSLGSSTRYYRFWRHKLEEALGLV